VVKTNESEYTSWQYYAWRMTYTFQFETVTIDLLSLSYVVKIILGFL